MKNGVAECVASEVNDFNTHCVVYLCAGFWAGNQGNHQNFDPFVLPYKFGVSLAHVNSPFIWTLFLILKFEDIQPLQNLSITVLLLL